MKNNSKSMDNAAHMPSAPNVFYTAQFSADFPVLILPSSLERDEMLLL